MKERKHNRIATTVLLLLVFSEIGIAEIVTKPTGTEVVVDGSTYLNCSTNTGQEIHWFHTAVGSNQDRTFVYGYNQFYYPYIGRFQMERNEAQGAFNLVITSVEVDDAGVYECQDEIGRGDKKTAKLIVLDTDPVSEPRLTTYEVIGPNKCGIEPSPLVLSCIVTYHGNEAPIMEWHKAGQSGSISEGVTHEAIANNRVVYNLTIKGNSAGQDGASYFCNTTRSTTGIGCEFGKIKVTGAVGYRDAAEICKPYSAAIICIFLIILPTAICGTVFVLWYLWVYRPKKQQEKEKDNQENGAKIFKTGNSAKEATSDTSEDEEEAEKAALAKENLLNQSEEHSSVPDRNVKKLQDNISTLQRRIDRRNRTLKQLREKDDSNTKEINSLKLENEQLKDLEQHLYPKENIDYADKPVLAYTIQLSGKNNIINGITVLGNELFVVTEGSQELEVYDSKTFHLEGKRMVRGLAEPLDIASSKPNNCLYVMDRVSEVTESKLMRLDPRGKVLKQWSTGGENGRLSTYKSNVILCLFKKQVIIEYSPNGEIIATVRLSPAAKLNHPWHAIKVTSAHFVVSHGDVDDDLHRVCVVDLEGNIKKECTKWEKSKFRSRTEMKVPYCLVEDNERSIIVADRDNNRLLLLSSQLKYQRKLIEKDHGLIDDPVRLCFDDTQSKLFVAVSKRISSKTQWEDGRIQIFNIK